MTGTNFSSWYNQSEGTFVANGTTGIDSSIKLLYRAGPSGGGSVGPYARNSLITVDKFGTGTLFTAAFSGTTKTAMAYNSAGISGSTDAGAVGSSAQTMGSSGTQITIGSDLGASNFWNGWVASIVYYPRRLPNATLQSLTS
jgi:hypothetical protein